MHRQHGSFDKCIVCRELFSAERPKSVEHIIPEFAGGGLTINEVCKPCNSNMGSSFEGRLSNNIVFTAARYKNEISGKKGSVKHPLSGTYEIEGNRKIRITDEGNIELLPKYSIDKWTGPNEATFSINESADNIGLVKSNVLKMATRAAKKKGFGFSGEEISKFTQKALDSANIEETVITNPEVNFNWSLDISDIQLLFIKIAYEIAFYTLGDKYLSDNVGIQLAESLKLQNPDLGIEMRWDFVGDDIVTNTILDPDFHWIHFKGNSCIIRLFSLIAFVPIVDEDYRDSSPDTLYRFCFKTGKTDEMSFMHYLAEETSQGRFDVLYK